MANLYVTRVSPSATLPTRATPFSAGLDIACCFHEPTVTVFDDSSSEERLILRSEIFRLISRENLNNDYPFETINDLLSVHLNEGVESYLMGTEFTDEELENIKTNLDLLSKHSVEREVVNDSLTLNTGERAMIPTGLKMSCDANHYLAFYPRSGNALKRGLTLINCTGIGDIDYSDEYYITLVNNSKQPQTITNGDKLSQMIVRYYADVDICERLELPQVLSNRAGGFGSTGK